MENEIWKPIKGYEGYYEISNFGRVKSVFRYVYSVVGGRRPIKEGIKPSHVSSGYKCVMLSKNGKDKNFLVHRLVATHFIPNPQNLPQVNHIDENKFNNNVENLEWCDEKYNTNYGTGTARRVMQSTKPVQMIDPETGMVLCTFNSGIVAGIITNGNYQSISKVCNGKYKISGGYCWKFAPSNTKAL